MRVYWYTAAALMTALMVTCIVVLVQTKMELGRIDVDIDQIRANIDSIPSQIIGGE